MTEPLTPHAGRNREAWNAKADDYQAKHGAQIEAAGGAAWGMWQISEDELHVLGDVRDRDVLEFGCGAAQWSIALARRGARVTGLDLSSRQLDHARLAIAAAGVDVALFEASAEAVPLPDASFDVVFCDHGAMSFADPYLTVPEAARLLRPGGVLAFSTITPFAEVHWPLDTENPLRELVRDYFDLHRIEDEDLVVFNLPYGEWIRLFGAQGLIVEDLVELRPAADATTSYRPDGALEWTRRWPMENIWKVRRR
jgi:SAM-dependent methyltransferase